MDAGTPTPLDVFVTESDRKSTRLNSSHTEIYTLSLHDALPIWADSRQVSFDNDSVTKTSGCDGCWDANASRRLRHGVRSEEHTSELQSHRDLHSFPTRRSSDLGGLATGFVRQRLRDEDVWMRWMLGRQRL